MTRPLTDPTSGAAPRELPLVERDAELAVLTAAVTGLAAGRSGYVELTGPPGSGHTTLLRHAMAAAATEEVDVLHASGTPDGPGADVVGTLATTLSAATGARTGCPAAPLAESFVRAARDRPLLLVLDDAQWMDERSWLWLRALLTRLDWAPLLVLVAVVDLGGPAGPGAAEREHAAARHLLRLRPLTVAGVRRLLGAVPGAPVGPDAAVAVRDGTRGVPSVVRAVPFAATDADDLAAVLAEARGDWTTRVMRALAAEPAALARAAAVCGDDADWELVCAVAGLAPVVAARAAGVLRRAGLADGHPGRPVLFTEPVVVERVLAGMRADPRSALFRRVLTLGLRVGADPAFLSRVALNAPAGCPGTVDLLHDEARRLIDRHGDEQAARLLERALRERPAEPVRARLMIELAGIESVTAPEASDRRLVRVLLGGADVAPPLRLRAADMLVSQGRPAMVRRTLTTAARTTGLADADRDALTALCDVAEETILELDDYSFGAAVPSSGHVATPSAAAVSAWRLAVRGRRRERASALARTALDVPSRSDHPLSPRLLACSVLTLAGHTAEAAVRADALLVEARREGMRGAAVWALLTRAAVSMKQENWDEAGRFLDWMAQELPEPGWHPTLAGHARALVVILHLRAGRLEEARRSLAAPLPDGVERSMGGARVLFASGLVRLAEGASAEALELFQESGRRMLARQWLNPVLLSWRMLAGMANQAGGATEEARRLVYEELQLADGWGEPGYLEWTRTMGGALLEQS